MIVYVHKNPTTKVIFYVGIGASVSRAYKFKDTQRNKLWHKYVNKYGIPIVEIIAENISKQEAIKIEIDLIAKYGRIADKSGILTNISIGGDGGSSGIKQSIETIQKRAFKLKGFSHSDESKKNMKEAQNRPDVKAKHSVYKNDPAWRELQRNLKLGRKLTYEHKDKISKSQKGKITSQETKQKISLANKGKKRTNEQKIALSIAFKGRIRSKESIEKSAMSNSKVVLNTNTGVYYDSLKDAAASIPMNINTFRAKMSGHIKNDTPFIYA